MYAEVVGSTQYSDVAPSDQMLRDPNLPELRGGGICKRRGNESKKKKNGPHTVWSATQQPPHIKPYPGRPRRYFLRVYFKRG